MKDDVIDETAAALAALAQAARLRIFRALVGAGPAGLTPGMLAATLDAAAVDGREAPKAYGNVATVLERRIERRPARPLPPLERLVVGRGVRHLGAR